MWKERLFLWKVWKQNKWLFSLFCAFIGLTFYFNFKGVETTPFFIWAMFSGKMNPAKQYKLITVTYNADQPLKFPHTWQEPQSMMIYFTLNHYRKIESNRMIDPMQQVLDTIITNHPWVRPLATRLVSTPGEHAKYLLWLKTYIGSIVDTTVYQVKVLEKTVHFTKAGHVIEDSSKILYTVH